MARAEAMDQNRSERVRNGSELRGGRPPVLDDPGLDDLSQELHQSLGRLPKLDELIEAAGGCQRQRASRALQRLRLSIAQQDVAEQLRFPAALEAELRGWLRRWMNLAAQQLAERHALLEDEHSRAQDQAQALVADLRSAIADLRESLVTQTARADALAQRERELLAQVGVLQRERDLAIAVSDERRRLLEDHAVKLGK